MLNISKFMLAAMATVALAACGGGGSSAPAPVTVATSNLSASVTSAIANAVVNTPFVFSSGVPSFGTTATTTVVFTNSATTPAFSIVSGSNTATGVTTFGSCIFTVGASSFPVGSALATGSVIRFDPCSLNVATSGASANATFTRSNGRFFLGTFPSLGVDLSVSISQTGAVTINGLPVGTVLTGTVTGG